jgi:hypothetical protein
MVERGHPVRQRAKPAQTGEESLLQFIRAARSVGHVAQAFTRCNSRWID